MEALIDLTVKSTLLVACAAFVVLAMRRASAASRHLVWTGVLCAVAVLPIARLSLPALRIPVLKAAAIVTLPIPVVEMPQPPMVSGSLPTGSLLKAPEAATPASPGATARQPVTIADILAAIWIAGAILLAVRQVANSIALRQSVGRAQAVTDPQVLGRLELVARDFRLRRRIALFAHKGHELPCTFGVWRPTILVPGAFLESAPGNVDARLDLILVHEVAHIARLDALADRISQVAVMIFWFNPLVWVAARQARFERERAADDAVLASGARPSEYATDLLYMARSQSLRLMRAALPMAASGLERRVRAILDAGVRRGRRSRASVALATTLLAATFPVSAARLVARVPRHIGSTREAATISPIILAGAPARTAVQLPAPRQATGRIEPTQTPSAAVSGNLIGVDDVLATQASQTSAQAGTPQTAMPTTRVAMMKDIFERAKKSHENSLKRVEIGTAAPIDTVTLETALGQIEQAYLAAQADQKLLVEMGAPQSIVASDLDAARARMSQALRNLDAAEVRFDNGLISTREIADALKAAAAAAAKLPILPAVGVTNPSPGDQMFTSVNFPGSSAADRNSARALYELLTGRVSSINGNPTSSSPSSPPATLPAPTDANLLIALQNADKIKSESDRADALIAIAQRYALTPEMVAAYVAGANSIKNDADRARVFAQAIRVKSPGKTPEYYWQR